MILYLCRHAAAADPAEGVPDAARPLTPEGIKTAESDRRVDEEYVTSHLRIGIDSLKQLINKGVTVKHLKF